MSYEEETTGLRARIRELEAELAERREYMEAVDEPAYVKMKARVAELTAKLKALGYDDVFYVGAREKEE